MLRIMVVSHSPEEAVLKVEGWVAEDNVSLLEQEGDRCLDQAERLVLDLRGVRFIDRAGIALLQRWSGKRLGLRRGSSFIRALLKVHGLDCRQQL